MGNKKHLLVLAFLTLLVFVLYSVNLNDFFVSDDFDWINLTRSSDKPLYSYFVSNYYGNHDGGSYRPLINVSFWLDNQFFGLNPFGYHVSNLIFYLGCLWLIYFLILKIFRDYSEKNWLAFFVCLFFAVLPSHVEVVAWLSARGDAICMFFFLLAFYLYLFFRDRKNNYYLVFSFISFALALLAKEMAITLPLIIFAYEFFSYEGGVIGWLRNVLRSLVFFIFYCLIVAAFFVVRYFAIGIFIGYYENSNFNFTLQRSYEMVLNLLADCFLFLDQRLALVNNFQYQQYLFVLSVIVVLAAIFIIVRNYRLHLLFWFTFYFISIVPVINFIFGRVNDEGERYNFLPSLAFAVILSLILMQLKDRFGRITFTVLAIVLVLYFGYYTYEKTLIWDQASRISNAIVEDLPKVVDMKAKKQEGVVTFGLPDNYRGAQVMRNGFKQAVNLFYPDYKLDAIFVPVGLNLDGKNYQSEIMKWQTEKNGFLGKTIDGRFVVSGNATEHLQDFYFELWGYNYEKFNSNTIYLIFNDQFISKLGDHRVYFLTYNNGHLVDLGDPGQ